MRDATVLTSDIISFFFGSNFSTIKIVNVVEKLNWHFTSKPFLIKQTANIHQRHKLTISTDITRTNMKKCSFATFSSHIPPEEKHKIKPNLRVILQYLLKAKRGSKGLCLVYVG